MAEIPGSTWKGKDCRRHSGTHWDQCFGRRIESRLRAHRVEAEWLYRSDDGGETWSRVNEDQRLTQRAWYFTHIFADPKSADTVYMLNTACSARPTAARR